eukprot:TRINITY_DN503_c0_g1_i14.p1 TRINITY_DN503_c0_g1~~TRINITY_DN503_c0_g1_i14.p1  ORF type:complete len:193 (-),score=41.02 TRINITY_DN503_c0_g1_i14:129-707(-)
MEEPPSKAEIANAINRNENESEGKKESIPPALPLPRKDPHETFNTKVKRFQNTLISLAYFYLTYQTLIVVYFTVYFYYQLDLYMPLAFIITLIICYLRSFTAFISLKLAYRSVKSEAAGDWEELRDVFYWTIVLIVIGLVIVMAIIPLEISKRVNINLMNLLIVNGVDFVLFAAMGFTSMRFCRFLIRSSPV